MTASFPAADIAQQMRGQAAAQAAPYRGAILVVRMCRCRESGPKAVKPKPGGPRQPGFESHGVLKREEWKGRRRRAYRRFGIGRRRVR